MVPARRGGPGRAPDHVPVPVRELQPEGRPRGRADRRTGRRGGPLARDPYRHRHRGDAAPGAGVQRDDRDRRGAAADRPNFPRRSEDLPGGVQFRLLPFGADSLTHFLYLERPEGMERLDAAGFVPTVPPREPMAGPRPSPARRTSARSATSTAASSRAWPRCPAVSANTACSSVSRGPRPRPSCSAGRSSSRCTTWRPRRLRSTRSSNRAKGRAGTGGPRTTAGFSASGRSTPSSGGRPGVRAPSRSFPRSPGSRTT